MLKKIVGKISDLLDRTTKIIYLDHIINASRKSFVTLDETGHGVFYWQQKIYETLEDDDDDDTLSHAVREEFEAEANYFASIRLFQHDRFNYAAAKLELGLTSVLHLSKHFGASLHATLMQFTEHSNKKCGLLVLKDVSKKDLRWNVLREIFSPLPNSWATMAILKFLRNLILNGIRA